jgi:hypothetical protein
VEESSGLVCGVLCAVVALRGRGFRGRGEERSLSSRRNVLSFSLAAGFGGVGGGLY